MGKLQFLNHEEGVGGGTEEEEDRKRKSNPIITHMKTRREPLGPRQEPNVRALRITQDRVKEEEEMGSRTKEGKTAFNSSDGKCSGDDKHTIWPTFWPPGDIRRRWIRAWSTERHSL